MHKKSKKCNGLTNTIYKQPYELYLKTIEYKNFKVKTNENIENNQSSELLNTSIPMECPDKIYLNPEVCYTIYMLIYLYNNKC